MQTHPFKNKTFLEAMFNTSSSSKKLTSYLEDKRLNSSEKKIIQGWLLLRQKKYEQLWQEIEPLQSDDPVVKINQHLLLSISYNNKGLFIKALEELKKTPHFHEIDYLPILKFQNYYYEFLINLNLKNINQLPDLLNQMKEYADESKYTQHRYLLSQFNLFVFQGDMISADKTMQLIESIKHQLDDGIKATFITAKFYYLIRIGDFKKCLLLLDDMKGVRSFMPKANYNYCKALLLYVVGNSPLYFDHSAFDDCPILLDQLMVIKCLLNHDLNQATFYWNKLVSTNQDIYQNDFKFHGETCLFSHALDKVKKNAIGNEQIKIPPGLSKQRQVEYVLTHSTSPISIESLYQLVWGKPIDNIQERQCLLQIVARIRKKGLQIEFKNQAYQVIKKSA